MKIRHEVFVVDVATEIYKRGFYDPRPKPAAAKYGENDHFIIGCCLKSFEESQKLSFLKNKLKENTFSNLNLGEDAPPQLIFCLDRPDPSLWAFPRKHSLSGEPSDFRLLARVWVASPEEEDVWKKVVTKEEMFEMLGEIRSKKMDLYEA
jgi:hypothetical protein